MECDSPIATEQIVPGRVKVNIHIRYFLSRWGNVRAWVFASHGLQSFGHREVVLAVSPRQDERPDDYPRDILALYRGLCVAVSMGKVVSEGGMSTFPDTNPTFLGRDDLGGVLYTWLHESLAELATPDALLGVFVTRGERSVAEKWGYARVLGLLGERARHYPTPSWLDRDRPEVVDPSHMASSFLGKIICVPLFRSVVYMTVPEFNLRQTGETGGLPDYRCKGPCGPVTLELDRTDLPLLRSAMEQIPKDATFALLTSIHPSIGRCLVWDPERSAKGEVATISNYSNRMDRRIAGAFFSLGESLEAKETRVFEDGFALLLPAEEGGQCQDRLAEGLEFDVTGSGGEPLLCVRHR